MLAGSKRLAPVVAVVLLLVAACGGDTPDGAFAASCVIARSELGPYSPATTLGATMDESSARARMQDDGVEEWIEISATGTWNQAWDAATGVLGQSIHVGLTWIDAEGQLTDLYEPGDSFGFTELRVSRSFQGKLEHERDPLYIGVSQAGTANFDAPCDVTALVVGDASDNAMLDVLEVVAEDRLAS